MSKKQYNNVNKRITIFIFANYLSSYYESQARHLYAISAFKISSYCLIKVSVFFFWKKGFFSLYEKYVFLSRPLLMHDLRGNYILFLNKPGTTSYGLSSLFSYVSAKLRNALPGFIRTYEFTAFKRESRAAFCTAAFLCNEYICKYYVFSRYLYMLCIFSCKCNFSKILAPVIIRKKFMTVCMLPLARRMRTLCNLRPQCLPYDR